MIDENEIIRQMQSNKVRPQSDLDYNLMLTNPVVGTEYVNQHIKTSLEEVDYVRDEEGKIVVQDVVDKDGNVHQVPIQFRKSDWELLGLFTRDFRLGFLEKTDLELCEFNLTLSYDLAQMGMKKSVATAYSRAIARNELSQSKNGFLRKRPNTLRTEHVSGELDPQRRTLFGGKPKQNQ